VGKAVLFLIAFIFATLIGGTLYLVAYDIPVPSVPVEREIDDARFVR